MKFLLLIFTFLLSSTTYAQTITYFDGKGDTVTVNDKWSYYIQLRQEKDQDSIWIEEKFSNNNQILHQKYFYYKSPDKQVRHGKYQKWNSKGMLLCDANFKNGYLDGNIRNYSKNGQLTRNEIYQMDSLISGHCYDSLGKEITHFPYEEQPLFKGGIIAMQKFIVDNVIYPEKALKKNETGRVEIGFVVNKDGSLSDIFVLKKVSPSLDKEALRVVKLMQGMWTPGYQDGEAVKFKMVCPVNFRLKR